MHRLMPEVPIITDISHICGRRDLLQITAQKALDIATDGFMIECHCNPDMALTDAEQQITPSRLETLLGKLVIRNKKSSSDESVLESLRERIDMIDNELLSLLSKRMQVSEEIGLFKKEHNVAVLQVDRWNKILNDRINKGMASGLDKHFVTEIFEAIHQESINRQL
jgi:chorismate mutase